MTSRSVRKKRRQFRLILLPSLLIAASILVIVASGYWSRSSRDEKYALPDDRSPLSMLKFLRKLDGAFERPSLLSESNLSAINDSVRKATEVLERESTGLSQAELREAQYYRLHFGYLAILTTEQCKDDGEWKDLLRRTERFLTEATQASKKESEVAVYAMKAYDTYQRCSEGIELARLIEDKFKSLPDGDGKSQTLEAISGIRNRLHLLGTELDLATNTLEGNPLQLRQFRGKVVLLDFYVTTCTPCLADFPALKRIHNSYHAKGFEILSVCLDAPAAKMESFVKKHQLPWVHVCHDPVEGNEELQRLFSINYFPTTMLIDQSGKLIKFGVRPLAPPGYQDRDLEEILKKLLQD